LGGPETPEEVLIGLVRLLIVPIIVLVFIRLWSYLTRDMEYRIILNSLSWILASIILLADVVLLTLAIYNPVFPGVGGPQITLLGLVITALILLSPLYFSLLFCFFVIRPRMRELHKDSAFLYSLPRQTFVYLAGVFLFLLTTGIIEAYFGLINL
jgi:hypothetical protein